MEKPIVQVEKQGKHSTRVPKNLDKVIQEALRKKGFDQGVWLARSRGAHIKGSRSTPEKFRVRDRLQFNVLDCIVQAGGIHGCRRVELIVPNDYVLGDVIQAFRSDITYCDELDTHVTEADFGDSAYSVRVENCLIPGTSLAKGKGKTRQTGLLTSGPFSHEKTKKLYNFWQRNGHVGEFINELALVVRDGADTVSPDDLDATVCFIWSGERNRKIDAGILMIIRDQLIDPLRLVTLRNFPLGYQLTDEAWIRVEERRAFLRQKEEERQRLRLDTVRIELESLKDTEERLIILHERKMAELSAGRAKLERELISLERQ